MMPHGMKINGVQTSIKDLNQRYEATYIEVSVKGKAPEVVYVQGFVEGDTPRVDKVYLRSKEKEFQVLLSDFVIVREFPEMGAVNIGSDVFIVSINPERQWHRGLCRVRIRSETRNPALLALEANLTINTAEALFNRTYLSKEKGLALIKAGEINSFAISAKYWYSGTKSNVYMWRGKVCLGESINGRLFFFDTSATFVTEVEREIGNLNG